MANQKITIDHTLVKGDKWYNMDLNGKKAGISVEGAPKTIADINSGAIEIECNVVEKDNKYFIWDKQEQRQSGGNGFRQQTPEQLAAKQQREDHTQRMIVAQSCYAATCNLKQQSSATHEDVLKMTKTAYDFIMELSK